MAFLPPADFSGVEMQPQQKMRPAGDPTLWANTITTLIDADPINGTTPRIIASAQIILAQAADRYSRSWSINGLLKLPYGGFSNISPSSGPPFEPDFETEDPLTVWLEVTQGIEKTSFTQLILLKGGPDAAGSVWGLCQTQCVTANGPYGQQPLDYQPIGIAGALIPTNAARPFAAIGALIGNTLSVRALYVRGGTVGQGVAYPQATITCAITPYAPGAGI